MFENFLCLKTGKYLCAVISGHQIIVISDLLTVPENWVTRSPVVDCDLVSVAVYILDLARLTYEFSGRSGLVSTL